MKRDVDSFNVDATHVIVEREVNVLMHVHLLHEKNVTGGPRYLREIGTGKYVSHLTNSHKRPRMTLN